MTSERELLKKDISKWQKAMDEEARLLRRKELFTSEVGDFWSVHETRNYMRARLFLADNIKALALANDDDSEETETMELWDEARLHYQELLRLCEEDNLGVRQTFPFVLIHLNRDDDAYSFCRYWLHYGEDCKARMEKHANSIAGEWLYPEQEGCKYLDIFEQCPEEDPETMDLAFLVAICIIKLRVVAALEGDKKLGSGSTTSDNAKLSRRKKTKT